MSLSVKKNNMNSKKDDQCAKVKKESLDIKRYIIINYIYQLKQIWLVSNIFKSRQKSISKIISAMRSNNTITNLIIEFASKSKTRSHYIITKIMSSRLKAIGIIKRCMTFYKNTKYVKSLLEKSKRCYTIISTINNINNIDLKVYLDNNQVNLYKFDYCKIRNKFVLYISRSKIDRTSYKVNFIVDGKTIIDPAYPTDYENGNFYNVINFKKIDEKEQEEEFEKGLCIKYYTEYINKELRANQILEDLFMQSNSTNFEEVLKSTSSLDSITCQFKGKLRSSDRAKTTYSGRFSKSELNVHLKMVKTQMNLLRRPKSILKNAEKSTNTIHHKKVSFGSVQFSY
jgi:hypothetical protein